MRTVVRAFSLPKAGNAPEEYEDAFWPVVPVDGEVEVLRLAVADGATETSFSGIWADILTQSYCKGELGKGNVNEELTPLQQEWRRRVGERPLPWYAEEKMRFGAFATLAGLNIEAGGIWSAFAVGDSCVFHLRGSRLERAFPIERAEQFDSRPVLLSSNPCSNVCVGDAVRRIDDGLWQPGDAFYLMTDALACYFLRRWELRDDDPQEFLSLFDEISNLEQFACRIELERAETTGDGLRLMRNDDVTFMRCQLSDQRLAEG